MSACKHSQSSPPSDLIGMSGSVEVGLRFLQTVFEPTDTIMFRPIESWTEAGKRKNHVLYDETIYLTADEKGLLSALERLLPVSSNRRANLYFSVCPRFGRSGNYDLAWQIRVVRTLWIDIDHITVHGALERVENAGLPYPSIVVNSGNGVHLYWLLDKPYFIDDAGDPPLVETEWIVTATGKRKRKYIWEHGDKVYLDQRKSLQQLSPKAQSLKDVLAGIAQSIGGDHAIDLSRLLRLPGSLNRKDERNGKDPVSTQLAACDASRRYAFTQFESFKVASPELERIKRIRSMPLPKVRKPCTKNLDRLEELIAVCSLAPLGGRSESDFALCCFAIEKGLDKESTWSRVETVGKFSEQGRRYFDVTWEAAEFQVREQTCDRLLPAQSRPHQSNENTLQCVNLAEAMDADDEVVCARDTVEIDPTVARVIDILAQITQVLMSAKICYLYCDQLVVVKGSSIHTILSAVELAGLLNEHVEFYVKDAKRGQYKPLPTEYGNTYLNQRAELSRLPQLRLFTRNPVFNCDWELVLPGFDPHSGVYYAGQAIRPRTGTVHLDSLLQDFCFKTPGDRTNFLAILLTTILMPHFVGSKPGVILNGNQPGLGKTLLAQTIAIIRDGCTLETVTYNPNDEEFEKRLGSVIRRGVTTIIVDNAKGSGRNPRIESACLERSMTDPILSFRLLGKSLEIRAENAHIFVVTANSPEVSPDLISRSVVINLEYEGDPRHRTFRVADSENFALQNRGAILGELMGMVDRWISVGSPLARASTRFNKRGWGHIIGGILDVNGEPDFLANAEESALQLDNTRAEFEELVLLLVEHPNGNWTSQELVEFCRSRGLLTKVLGDGTPRSQATKFGAVAARFTNERFGTFDGGKVVFSRTEGRKGNVYRVERHVSAVP